MQTGLLDHLQAALQNEQEKATRLAEEIEKLNGLRENEKNEYFAAAEQFTLRYQNFTPRERRVDSKNLAWCKALFKIVRTKF